MTIKFKCIHNIKRIVLYIHKSIYIFIFKSITISNVNYNTLKIKNGMNQFI